MTLLKIAKKIALGSPQNFFGEFTPSSHIARTSLQNRKNNSNDFEKIKERHSALNFKTRKWNYSYK